MARYAGVDIGTSAVKVGIYDDHGRRLVFRRFPTSIDRAQPRRAEQAASAWLGPVRGWLASIGPVDRTCFGGLMNTYVPVSEDGAPLRPAIMWEDRRCTDDIPADLAISSYRSRAQWIREFEPETWSRARWLLLPKDYVLLGLSGEAGGDVLSWNGVLAGANGDAVDPSLGADMRARIPPLVAPDSVVASKFGPLVVGVPDTVAAVLGCGPIESIAYSLSGTSEAVVIAGHRRAASQGVRNVVPLLGRWLHAGPSSVGGVTIGWAADVFTGGEVTGLIARARASRHPSPPLFVPYLSGERAPVWDVRAAAGFFELDASHNRDDLCLSVLEGIQFAARRLLEAVEASSGAVTDRMRGAGGTLVEPFVAQMRADRCGRVLEVAEDPEVGTRGAAALAAAGDMDHLERTLRSFEPRFLSYEPRVSSEAEERYERWRAYAERERSTAGAAGDVASVRSARD